ncbi:hypothetical protein [Nitrobacter hamburgensis]|uniref:hypothetical protein n=1 Tax=Nitrobacter hamburgensis TaxID=912 RepID=UPI00031C3095|nr:hypothetical protein [Nitrobacter hamburgensis]
MGTFSLWHWLIAILLTIAIVTPFWKIFGRLRIPRILSVFAIVPFVSILYLWIIAYKKWPPDAGPR